MIKAFRFRVYPTAAQVTLLGAWTDGLRFLWNLAHQQRLMGLQTVRDRRHYYSAYDQINELTELRAQAPWVAAVPRNVCAQLLMELDKAWQRAFRRTAQPPRFKKRGRDGVIICEPHPKIWEVVGGDIRFPKLGIVKTVMHRPIEGKPKTCTIVQDGDAWYASIVCELPGETPEPGTAPGPAVAIERSAIVLIADSDGRTVANPVHLARSLSRLKRAERRVNKKKKGSQNKNKAVRRLARLNRKVRRQRDHHLHVHSTHYAKHHGVVVIAEVAKRSSTSGPKRARGAMLDAAWGRFGDMLAYKLAWRGGVLLKVPAAKDAADACAACGQVAVTSEPASERFACPSCGQQESAVVNAARVLLSRGIHGVAACGGPPVREPLKQEHRAARHGPRSRRPARSSGQVTTSSKG